MKQFHILLFLAIFLASGCQISPEAVLSINQNIPQKEDVFEPSEEPKYEPVSLGPVVVPEKTVEPVVKPVVDPVKVIIDKATSTIKNLATTSSITSGNSQSLVYPVAFATQAPFANWNPPFDEACEEASMIMVAKYYQDKPLTNSIMNTDILELVDWQTSRGYKVDLTVNEAKEVLLNFFGLTSRLLTNPTVDDMKKELDQGNLIIVPAAGRELFNPYFTPPGPIYHMLVIIGYDDTTFEFITNDPGTRRGEKLRYSYQILLNANHNWNHDLAAGGMTDSEMVQGSQTIIIVDK